jgi:DNA-binding GntR family transcriptional regulator
MPRKPKNKQRLGDKAYDLIRERIVTLQLLPGEQIDEAALEKGLSIGRTPIREALQRLTAEKLLESVPGRGFYVRAVSIDDVKSLFEALTTLERFAVHLAAQRIQKDQIKRLSDVSDRHKAAMARQDFLKVTVLNSEFHHLIHAATHNTFLQNALKSFHHQAERLAFLTYTKEAHPKGMEAFNQKAIQDHEMLVESFASGDAEKAVEVMTAHFLRFFLRVCHYMEPRVYRLESFLERDLFMKPV